MSKHAPTKEPLWCLKNSINIYIYNYIYHQGCTNLKVLLAQLKNQNTHMMAPRGEEENGAILAGT